MKVVIIHSFAFYDEDLAYNPLYEVEVFPFL